MIDTLPDLRHALHGSPLAGRDIATLCVPDSHEVVFAVDVNGIDALQAWQLLRSLSTTTGRWPVLTMLHTTGSGSRDSQVLAEDLLSRFYFEEERHDARLGDSPADIIAAAAGPDIAEQFATFRADTSLTTEEALDIAREETLSQYGKAPLAILGTFWPASPSPPSRRLKNGSCSGRSRIAPSRCACPSPLAHQLV